MEYNAYELLGLSQNCTRQEATDKYYELRKKYLDDRFLPGEEGERAAEKLQELEVAYRDVLEAIARQTAQPPGRRQTQAAKQRRKTHQTTTAKYRNSSSRNALMKHRNALTRA